MTQGCALFGKKTSSRRESDSDFAINTTRYCTREVEASAQSQKSTSSPHLVPSTHFNLQSHYYTMVLKLHGVMMATCTQTVLAVAKQLNVQVELVPVNYALEEHKSPEYLKKQPFGQIPYLVRPELNLDLQRV